jgi:uncharacterized protein
MVRNTPNDELGVPLAPLETPAPHTGVGSAVSDASADEEAAFEDGLVTDIQNIRGKVHVPERKCVLTGAHGAPAAFIRLALSPENTIMPDVRARAPGRGAWIAVGMEELQAAMGKKLRGALLRAFKLSNINIAADLPAQIAQALEQNALQRLGLENRAGHLLFGQEKINAAARAGQVHLLYHAYDSAEDGRGKLDQALRVGARDWELEARPTQVVNASRDTLSLALGRENVVHIAVTDARAAQRLAQDFTRWHNFTGFNAVNMTRQIGQEASR